MALNVTLIRDSFRLISPHSDKLMYRFYEILFDRYPSVTPLFVHARMEEQRQLLLRSIARVVRKLEDGPYLKNYLEGLGQMHVAYGALPAHYDAVGECLIAAMQEVAGKHWTQEIQAAWVEACGAIKGLMLDGAKRAS